MSAAAGPSRKGRKLAALGASLAVPQLLMAAGSEPPGAVGQAALQACANITVDAERLACYDRLLPPATGKSAPPPQTPAAVAPPAAATPSPAAPPSAAAPAVGVPAPLPRESFGLYTAEHPKPPPVPKALEAAVVALGKAPGGRMTVQLEGGAWWELEDADPLLAVGDTVTVTRAALGSYLMRTPAERTHRVRRLR